MSFVLQRGRGGSHQFERQENSGSTWTSVGLCHKCKRPFIGAFGQTPVRCRACDFIACQGCASNQADWDSGYRCVNANALTYQDLEDIDEPLDKSRVVPPCVQEYRKQLMEKHDQLLDCIRELRTTTKKYREEVESAVRVCSQDMGASHFFSSSVPVGEDRSQNLVPAHVKQCINQRLAPCTNVLVEQATAVRDLAAHLRSTHCPGSYDSLTARVVCGDLKVCRDLNAFAKPCLAPQSTVTPSAASTSAASSQGGGVCGGGGEGVSGGVGEGGGDGVGCGLVSMRRQLTALPCVQCVPIVGGSADVRDSVDVTRLIHKVYQYRTDEEIEEGLCARLSWVMEARDIVAQVEQLLPALTNILVYTETEMLYLTREVIRLCMSSRAFASRFICCLRTQWPHEGGFAQRLEHVMCCLDFDAASTLHARVAKLIWLATLAITLSGTHSARTQGSLEEEHVVGEKHLLALALQPSTNKYLCHVPLKEALERSLRIDPQHLTSLALVMPFVTGTGVAAHSRLVLCRRQELAVVTEPLQQHLLLAPGRYTVEVTNLDTATGGTPRVADVLFKVELPGCQPDALKCVACSGEAVVLHLEVLGHLEPPTSPAAPSARIAARQPGIAAAMAKGGGERCGEVSSKRGGESCEEVRSKGRIEASQAATNLGKVHVLVTWKDDYQLAFAVELAVRVELPDTLPVSPLPDTLPVHLPDTLPHSCVANDTPSNHTNSTSSKDAGVGKAVCGVGAANRFAAAARLRPLAVGKGDQELQRVGNGDQELQRAIRLSMETHLLEVRGAWGAVSALRQVTQQHKLLEELVEISRQLLRQRRGLPHVVANDPVRRVLLLNRELVKRLEVLNCCIPQGAYLLLRPADQVLYEVLSFVVSECKAVETPHKVHYMLMLELRRVQAHDTTSQAHGTSHNHSPHTSHKHSPHASHNHSSTSTSATRRSSSSSSSAQPMPCLSTAHLCAYEGSVEEHDYVGHGRAYGGEDGCGSGRLEDGCASPRPPYISSQPYHHCSPWISKSKMGKGVSAGGGGGGGGGGVTSSCSSSWGTNALAESFVVVKDEVQDADTVLDASTPGPYDPTASNTRHGANPTATNAARGGGGGGGGGGVGLARCLADSAFGEAWEVKKKAIRQTSRYAKKLGSEWELLSVIVKSHDDLRQDQLAAQLLFFFDTCFKEEKLPLRLRPYGVLATTMAPSLEHNGGILETITDATAIDTLKKTMGGSGSGGGGGAGVTFADCFDKLFGGKTSAAYAAAQHKFVSSMAAYSVFCYVMCVKDRHNGNILLCRDGSIAHVDFGIMLNVRYAKDFFELNIKLSNEFVQVIGDKMEEFESLCQHGYLAIRKHSRHLLQLLEINSFSGGEGTGLPCLQGDAVDEVKRRLKLSCTDRDAEKHMYDELQKANQSLTTDLLDRLHNWTHANH